MTDDLVLRTIMPATSNFSISVWMPYGFAQFFLQSCPDKDKATSGCTPAKSNQRLQNVIYFNVLLDGPRRLHADQ